MALDLSQVLAGIVDEQIDFELFDMVTDEELRTMVRVSKTMATLLRKGATVLSTCHMGWNRSGILSTLALMELGATPETAVLAVRSARGPNAMSNMTFCRIVAALHDGTLKVS